MVMKWVLRMLGLGAVARDEGKPILDRSFLARLEEHMGSDVLTELVADSVFELTDRIARLREHAEKGEVAAIASLCHDITSVAGHMGLSGLSAAAVEVNRIARLNPDADAAHLADPIISNAPVALAELRAFLDERRAPPQNRTG